MGVRFSRRFRLGGVAGVLYPYPDDELQVCPMSKQVNDPAFDDPQVVVEAAIGEQVGFDEFGREKRIKSRFSIAGFPLQ